jgi:NAD(P)H-flavin reductase
LIEHLYESLFARRPYLASLFPGSMDFQRQRLAQTFMYLIDNLHRPDQVRTMFGQLGRDHRKLGVWPVHYDTFESALCEALRARTGQENNELEMAWLRVLRFAVDCMLSGAAAADSEPPYWHSQVIAHDRRRPDLAVLRMRTNEPYPYQAGQYGTLESPLLPQSWRQYSMACAPRQDNVLEFHVRLTGLDGVSEALVERTRVGDVLRLGPAHGMMTLIDEPSRDLLLVAGGTGLAPLKALLEELAAQRPADQRVHLFVGARTRADLYDWDALVDMDRRCPWLDVVPVISEEPWFSGETGMVADVLSRYGDWSEHVAYVSGPPKMVEATMTRLIEMDVPEERIHHDPIPGTH